jgi:hypothetical protein
MMGILTTLLITRSDFEAVIFRQRGSTFQVLEDGRVSNIFEISLTNKTRNNYKIKLEMDDPNGEIKLVVDDAKLKKEGYLKERFIVKMPMTELTNGKKEIRVKVLGNGKVIKTVKAKVIGPMI